MKKNKWLWMPHPGHFICSANCKFVLNTYVGKYIVSTVGELWSERAVREIHARVHNNEWLIANKHLKGDAFDYAYMEKFGYADIGCDRKYETMVFKSCKSKQQCCPYKIRVSDEMDFEGYNKAEDACKGHLRLCNKWSVK